jgi:hypothetical protein
LLNFACHGGAQGCELGVLAGFRRDNLCYRNKMVSRTWGWYAAVWVSAALCGACSSGGDSKPGAPGGSAGASGSSSAGSSAANGGTGGSAGQSNSAGAGGAAACVGRCPVDLVTDLDGPCALAIDSTHLYILLLSEATLLRAPLAGGTPETIARVEYASAQFDGLAVDLKNAYFTNTGAGTHSGIMKQPLAGGALVNLALDAPVPGRLRIDAQNVYFTSNSDVDSVPIEGGAAPTHLDNRLNQGDPDRLVVDSSHVYWSQIGTSGYELKRVPILGGTPETLVSNSFQITDLGVDGTNVYFLSGGDFESVPLAGGLSSVISLGLAGPGATLLLDGDTVYLSKDMTNSIVKLPKAGGPPVTVATNQHPHGLTANATNLYWIESDPSFGTGGVVRTIAK